MKRFLIKLTAVMLTLMLAVIPLSSCKKPDVYYVKLTICDLGEIVLQLDRLSAPETVDNFVELVEDGFYDGLTFHRVIKNFMIQGGDPKADGTGGSDKEIYGEFFSNGYYGNSISHVRGVISMARSNDPNSASSQFFICNADATHLDGSYAAFGYVIEGMDVVDLITSTSLPYATGKSGAIPNKANQVVIEKAEVLKDYGK